MSYDDDRLLAYSDADHSHEFAQEHQRILELVEALFARDRAGAAHAELLAIVHQLELRTAEHFRNEENYMFSIDYSGSGSHQRVHRHLLNEFARRRNAYMAAGGALPPKLTTFIRDWLLPHFGDNHRKQAGFAAMSRR